MAMLDEFKLLLQKFVKKECGIDEVTKQLDELLKRHPQLAAPIQEQIDNLAKDKRIDQSAADAIRDITGGYLAVEIDDKTVISTGGSDDDSTEISDFAPAASGDDDSTEIAAHAAGAGLDGQTLFEGDNTSATAVEDDDATAISTEIPVQQDDGFGLDLDATGSTATGATSPTSPTIGPDGMPVMAHGNEIIDVGSILRNRFELISKLGEGGMGAVFLAVDKIKEEAQDKNPKVAVKVLNETFKQFRESFIALQRESSKQQRLAHPNIATVFDFDRDYTYGTVFMTMEYMEGEPLDKFIRRIPAEGLSYKEARPMIEGMCNGLAYAHHHDLVHSDFKPANTFLLKDGVIKLLDFGIARAATTKVDEHTGKKETTLFDPGTLGALTPAYASAEMLEGETPEPADDIYALACVTYQLLGGKHPFNKMPANQARDNKLTPARIKKLNGRQWKTLKKGLEFSRAKRTQQVEEFLDGITPKKPILAYALTATFIMLAIIGVLSKGVIEEHLRNERNKELTVSILNATDNQQMAQNLSTLQSFDQRSQDLIKADPEVAKAIVSYFTRRMDAQINKEQGKYNYPTAYQIMEEARAFYRDSGTLDNKLDEINSNKTEELDLQRDLYTRFLKIGPWLPVEGPGNDVPDVIATIKTIQPDHALLTDPRLVGSYIKEAQGARQEGQFDRSRDLLAQAEQFAEDKAPLINEADKLLLARHLAANQARLQTLVDEVAAAGADKGLKQALSVSDQLAQIQLMAPENELLAAAGKKATEGLLAAIAAAKTKEALTDTTRNYHALAGALSSQQQASVSAKLDAAWQKLGGVDGMIAQQQQQDAQAIVSKIDETANQAEFTHEWAQNLRALTQELTALLGAQNATTQETRRKLATRFMDEANKAMENQRLVQSSILIDHANYFDAAAPGLTDAQKMIADALEQEENARIERERLATIAALKQDTLAKARSEKVEDALRFLDLLKVYLLPDDPFLTTEGPAAIGRAYASLSLRAKQNADKLKAYIPQRDAYIAALETVKTGMEIAPESQELLMAQAQIQNALNITEVRNEFLTSEKLDIGSLKTQLNRIKSYDARAYAGLQTEFSEVVAQRIATMESYDPQAAKAFLDSARALPINQVLLSRIKVTVPEPSKYAKDISEAIKNAMLTEASSILKKALTEESDHPEIKRLRGVLAERVKVANDTYKLYQAALRKNDIEGSKQMIAKALKIWRDNTEFKTAFDTSLKKNILASKAICQTRLAGYGKRSRGRCYDMVSNETEGPIMVVLPAGAGHDSPFAISKYEITVHDFNQYCEQTKKCQKINKGKNLPVTGISVAQAKAYAEWLSEKSGAKYRLPTDKEWAYAANAAGKQPTGKSYNCTLRLGDKIIKGTGLEDANSGKQNGWGLANYLGNAQEWVESPSGLKVKGGAYKDAMQECTVELERAHDGSPDEYTTFRVVRNII